MNRLFAIVALLLIAVARIQAQSSDDQYVQIYNLIQDGDALAATNKPAEALAKYTQAQYALVRFQKFNLGWNDRVVSFRLNYLASKITIVSASLPQSQAPAAPVAPAPAPRSPVEATKPPPARPVTSAPVNSAPIPPKPIPPALAPQPRVALPQPSQGNDLQNQIADLHNQIRQFQADKALLQAKLREALSARPVGSDPQQYAKAQDLIRQLQKQNDLLEVTLAREKSKAVAVTSPKELDEAKRQLADARRQLADQTARASQLAKDNESLQAHVKTLTANDESLTSLRMENQMLRTRVESTPTVAPAPAPSDVARRLADAEAKIAALESDKEVWRLEKIALQNRVKQLAAQQVVATGSSAWTGESEHVKQLERERDDLQKKLDAAQKELYGRNSRATAARVDELAEQMETLRARLDIYESKPVPYTAEEMNLFRRPMARVTDPHAGEKSSQELPPGTVELVASAQRDFSTRSYAQAEKKYLEVIRRDDRNASTRANLAAIQLEMNHFDDAERNIKAALSVSPNDAYSLSLLGNLRFRQGKYDDALDALSRAAKADPQNAEVQNFLGLTLSEKGLRSAAETAFRKAIILNPNYGGAQNNLAVFYLTQKPPSVELARWHYEKALATGFPHNPDMEKMLAEKERAQ